MSRVWVKNFENFFVRLKTTAVLMKRVKFLAHKICVLGQKRKTPT